MGPAKLEMMINYFRSIAGEMLMRLAGFSQPYLDKSRYNAAGLFTLSGDLVIQEGNIHRLGILPVLVKSALREHPVQSLARGDVLLTNDPYAGCPRLTEFCVISPVYHAGVIMAVTATLAGHQDAGGSFTGGMSTGSREIFQEGIRVPTVKIASGDSLNKDILALIRLNMRTGDDFTRILRGQMAANGIAGKRINNMAVKYGPEKVKKYMQEIIDYSERILLSRLKVLARGKSTGRIITGHNKSGLIMVSAEYDGDTITFDFSGTQPQSRLPVNASKGTVLSCILFSLLSALDLEVPFSGGLLKPIRVIAPEGSMVNPVFPAPVAYSGLHTAGHITGLLLETLRDLIPGMAAQGAQGSPAGLTIGNIRAHDGLPHILNQTLGGGPGGCQYCDGPDMLSAGLPGDSILQVEHAESIYPVIFNEISFIRDSGGAGKFRGGTGIRQSVSLLGEADVAISADLTRPGAPGANGGMDGGRPGVFLIHPENGVLQNIESGKYTGTLEKGSVIILETGGGGGYGSPMERDPQSVRDDVVDGFISPQQALDTYGVVLTGDDFSVDPDATAAKRLLLNTGLQPVPPCRWRNPEFRIQNSESQNKQGTSEDEDADND
ncbi:MAG: hydantoinase B/oxoprolinase family protein [Bacillota bacterium]